jgi:hypothetical protein
MLTIMRLHPVQVELPSQVLAIDLAKVCDEKCVFLSRFAVFVIDNINTLSERLRDQRLGICRAMVSAIISGSATKRLDWYSQGQRCILVKGSDSRRCHNQAQKSWSIKIMEKDKAYRRGTVLGRSEWLVIQAQLWTRPPRLFLEERKKSKERPMRQLRVG